MTTCTVDAAAHVGDLEATETSELVCSIRMSSTTVRACIRLIVPWEAPQAHVCGERYRTASGTLKVNIAPVQACNHLPCTSLVLWPTHITV